MSQMEGKLLEKISTLEDNVGAHVANIAARLDVLEGQSLSNFSMVCIYVFFFLRTSLDFIQVVIFFLIKGVKQTVTKLYQHVTVKILKHVFDLRIFTLCMFLLRSSLTSSYIEHVKKGY